MHWLGLLGGVAAVGAGCAQPEPVPQSMGISGEEVPAPPAATGGSSLATNLVSPIAVEDSLGITEIAAGEQLMAPFNTCLTESREAQPVALDVLIVLDSSGSMLDVLPPPSGAADAAVQTKWEALRDSLIGFVEDERSADIGIGLQYFPLLVPNVPLTCTDNSQCGEAGPCSNSVCVTPAALPADAAVGPEYLSAPDTPTQPCTANTDCSDRQVCRNLLGQCVYPAGAVTAYPQGASVAEVFGMPREAVCSTSEDCASFAGAVCERLGSCRTAGNGQSCTVPTIRCERGECSPALAVCTGQTRCALDDYSAPALPIARDAARTEPLTRSVRARQPAGRTPTAPALGGSLRYAQRWAETHPSRQVVTVFATDGLPTQCDPLQAEAIAQLAAEANAGPAAVKTFVIGVFGRQALDADGRSTLDAIAKAGGTENALVIATEGDVLQDFRSALNEIRDTTVSCDFQLESATALNFEEVNLTVTDADGIESTVPRVLGRAQCLGESGWYYLSDSLGDPTHLRVCPSTCSALSSRSMRAQLRMGCPSRLR